jgi:hypothetical protein
MGQQFFDARMQFLALLNPSALIPGGTGTINAFLQSGAPTDLINWSVEGPIFPVSDSSANTCSKSSPCDFFGVDQNLRTPYVLNWNLNLQQEIPPNTVLQIGYVANRGVS